MKVVRNVPSSLPGRKTIDARTDSPPCIRAAGNDSFPLRDQWFRDIFENLKDGLFIETPEGKILEVNRAVCEMLGYTREELLRMDVAAILPLSRALKLPKIIRKNSLRGGVYIESENVRKDGTRIPVEVSNTLVEIGGEKRIVAIIRDIRERKKAEEELARYRDHLEEMVSQRTAELERANTEISESEDRLRKIFEFTKDAMFIEKTTGEIEDANQAACAMLGYTREELLSKDVASVVIPEVARTLARKIRCQTVQEGVYIETEDMRKDGRRIPVEVSCTLVKINGQKRVIAILRDICERKLAQEHLEESEERFRTIFENSRDAMLVMKTDGLIMSANHAACKMLGYDKTKLTGVTMTRLLPHAHGNGLQRLFHPGMARRGAHYESAVAHRKGYVIPVEIGASMVTIWGEKRVVAIMRDIRERKRAEADLDRYKTHLEEMIATRTAALTAANQKLREEIAERKKAEAAVRSSERTLREQKMAVERKNIALGEILKQIEFEKGQVKKDVAINIEKILLPTIWNMKKQARGDELKRFEHLQHCAEELASSFGRQISDQSARLSAREVEICSMIKNGLSTKEIAQNLNLAPLTVEQHRVNIRKKLGISGKEVNLTTFLRRM